VIAPPPDPGRTVEVLFDSLFSDDSLDRSLQTGLQAVVATASAEMAAILVVDGGELIHQYWTPDERASTPAAEDLRRLVRDPMALRDPAGALARHGVPAETVILPLEAHGTVTGAVCYVPRGGAAPRGDLLRRVVRLIAFRTAAEIDQVRGHGIQARYERWFKTLDEQLRVLDRERQKFAAMVHTSDAAVFVTDLTRIIRWTNTVLSQRSPGGAAAWVGLECHDVCGGLSGDHSSRCRECPVERSLRENLVVHREFQVVRDGAAPLNFYLTALPIKGSDGRPHEAMVMIQDLSDLEILRASESRYRLLFERSALSIVMVDPATRQILLSNPTATDMTGYQPGELLTMRLDQLLSPEEWARLEPDYRVAVTHGDLVAHDCRVRHREGWERPTAISGTRTVFDGRAVLMLEFRDMTRTREVEETLRSLEERLRVVVANSPIVLFALDPHGIYTLSEGRGLGALGLAPGQRVGQSVFDVHKNSPRVLDIARRALAGEEFMEIIELGGSLVFEVSYTPMRGPDGAMQGVIGVATDVTERQRLEGQLRQVQRMESIGRLAGGVAHDFNNLLAAILGHSELMRSRLEPGHPLTRSAEEIQKAAGRGALLTRQLLSFGRRDMLSLQVLDLNQVVAGMEGMLRRLIGEDIELIAHRSDVPAWVRVDQGQIEQVVMNLVVNARDAMPHGGRLTLAVSVADFDQTYVQAHGHSLAGPHVVLTTSDTGVGMDAEAMSHVFEPFFTTKDRGKGTGLGLATVYGIAEQGGGHVTVESQPGEGSTFRFCLPYDENGQVPEEDPAAARPAPRGGTETLLLAEDEDSVRSMASEVLEALGYRVLCAADGAEALAIATGHEGAIDLLITDVVMPRLGGGELAERLTATRPGLRVLFISGYPDDAIVRHGVLEQRSVLLQKPFAIADFVRKVREILDAPPDQGRAAA